MGAMKDTGVLRDTLKVVGNALQIDPADIEPQQTLEELGADALVDLEEISVELSYLRNTEEPMLNVAMSVREVAIESEKQVTQAPKRMESAAVIPLRIQKIR